MAHDPRAGVLGLLAGRHGRVPHQRRHRRAPPCATSRRPATSDFERDVGLELLVETARLLHVARPPRPRRRLAHRRRHRPGRVQRDRRRQRLHEPDGGANLRGGGRRGPASPGAWRDGLGVDIEEEAGWRDAAATGARPVQRRARRARAVGAASPSTPSGTSSATATRYPLLLHVPYFDLYRKQVVKQADLVLAHALVRRPVHRRRTRRATSTTTSGARCATRRCRRAPRRCSRPRSAISSWPTTTRPRPRSSTCTTCSTTAGTGCTWRRWPGRGWRWSPGFGGLRDHGGVPSFDPALPEGLTRLCFSLRWRGLRLTVDVHPEQVTYSVRDGAGDVAGPAPRRRGHRAARRRAGHPRRWPSGCRCCPAHR